MTLQEFKAWFDGFTENMGDAPSKKQWARIQARVKEIDGTAVTYPVFIDRYVPTIPCWIPQWTGGTIGHIGQNINTLNDGHSVFNSAHAMCDLGKADYMAIG